MNKFTLSFQDAGTHSEDNVLPESPELTALLGIYLGQSCQIFDLSAGAEGVCRAIQNAVSFSRIGAMVLESSLCYGTPAQLV